LTLEKSRLKSKPYWPLRGNSSTIFSSGIMLVYM
jgi:hypothetical protein